MIEHFQEEGRKQVAGTYIMDQQDYPPYSMCPGYEMQIQPNLAHKTHTLPHPHHHHLQHQYDRNRARDDQSLGYHGNMSGTNLFLSKKYAYILCMYVCI